MLIMFMYNCCIKYHSQATWFQYPRYRYWRKNLAKLDGTDCIGVDLNRNFDVDWNQVCTYIYISAKYTRNYIKNCNFRKDQK